MYTGLILTVSIKQPQHIVTSLQVNKRDNDVNSDWPRPSDLPATVQVCRVVAGKVGGCYCGVAVGGVFLSTGSWRGRGVKGQVTGLIWGVKNQVVELIRREGVVVMSLTCLDFQTNIHGFFKLLKLTDR